MTDTEESLMEAVINENVILKNRISILRHVIADVVEMHESGESGEYTPEFHRGMQRAKDTYRGTGPS